MTEIKLTYNPFESRASYEYKGKSNLIPKCMGTGENSRLQDWLYEFFPELKEMHNWGEGSICEVSFHGSHGDFEDLEHAADIFMKDNPGIDIRLIHLNKETKDFKTRLSDLQSLFGKMQNESPYAELKDPSLKPRFEQTLNYEFEISVIATMSSGKSTLINALLGQEILPARNEATTAKIAQIRDTKDVNGFTVHGLKKDEDGNYKQITDEKNATLDELEKMNGSDEIDKIEIRGNILGINSREMRLILSDTPGPNNSRDITHAKHIDELIKADYKPMIMYILNATQLEITDDRNLLEKISKAMEGSGKQGADRFLFVLNKADQLDPGKNEFVQKKVSDSKIYLEQQFGIKGARIFPISAQLAKVIRMSQAGRKLTEDEEDFLAKKNRFITRSERHLSDFVSLSPSCRKKQEEKLQIAVANNDENTQALVYSGIPAIELAMDEYLEKYALTAKISRAVGVFITIINRLDLKNKEEKRLAENEHIREKVAVNLQNIRKQIENGGEAKKLKEAFDGDIKSIKEKLAASFMEYETSINKLSAEESVNYDSEDISKAKAKDIIDQTQRNMQLQYETLSADLSSLFEKELKNQAQDYLEKYRRYVSSLAETDGFTMTSTLNLVQVAIPDSTDELLNKFSGTKIVTKTVRKQSGNSDKKWWKPWTWFDDHYREWDEEVKTEKKIIEMKKLYENSVEPQFQQFYKMIEDARSIAEENAQGLKEFFTREIERLDSVLKEKIREEEESVKSQEAIKQKVEENKAKIEWLEQFIVELNAILEV